MSQEAKQKTYIKLILMSKRILILDDDRSVLDVMEEALSYSNYDVKTTQSSEELIGLLETYVPDIVLLDYILRGINGGEICHQIKSNPKTSALPVIIVSAYPRVLESLGDYGSDAIIPKPFDLMELLDKVENCLCATN